MRIGIPNIRALTREAINAALSRLNLSRVPELEIIECRFASTARHHFKHNLGRVPDFFLNARNSASYTVYASDGDRATWTDKIIALRTNSVAGGDRTYRIIVGVL